MIISGVYFFTLFANTRTCGSLSICGPTEISIFRNEIEIKSFATGSASNRIYDLEIVRNLTWLRYELQSFKPKVDTI